MIMLLTVNLKSIFLSYTIDDLYLLGGVDGHQHLSVCPLLLIL